MPEPQLYQITITVGVVVYLALAVLALTTIAQRWRVSPRLSLVAIALGVFLPFLGWYLAYLFLRDDEKVTRARDAADGAGARPVS